MEEYKKKTNTGDDVFIRLQKPKEPAPGTIPDDGQDHSLPRPTAVLLGWFAAKHKNLSKYGAIYEDMGYNVVQVIAPASVVFPLKPQYTAAFTLSLLRIIAADSHLTNGGIVFMMFSNGGAINAPHLSRMFTGEYQEIIKADDEPAVKTVREAVAGIIFDSAPCYMRSHLGARAINEGLKLPEGIFSKLILFAFTLWSLLQRLFIINLPLYFWTGLRRAEYLCPELYIYSTADHLSDIPSLEALVEERKQQGKEVRVFRVEDAGHVMILRNHHQKYVDTIRAVNDWGVNPYRSKAGLRPWLLQENDKS
ncbi:unnamed protein product [Chondrus crispus]|uniref:Uncharacterized protein n=1 Tax=Chondrus crispus TaxID=2769 RepID=R7QBB1_CHOCR|nr:unnamed protein product [Chondrus crispus]CDF34755.1 unnamed protein product [Chondrus crispus]|eukprot:XP_005714574.1 unnamed protein product [Chondrus crispus]